LAEKDAQGDEEREREKEKEQESGRDKIEEEGNFVLNRISNSNLQESH